MTLETIYRLLCIIPTVIFVFFILWQIAKHIERKNFNDGICKCGGNFRPFDLAVFIGSDGSRGYSCDKCNKNIFCSYDVDNNYKYENSTP